jgi:pycsar effector protein
MTTIDYLEKQYAHVFDMVKFAEMKNTILIAFDGAIIFGMAKLLNAINSIYLYYFLLYAMTMCCISIFISLFALVAKIKHSTNSTSLTQNDNLLFFATLAQMSHFDLIEKIRTQYRCDSSNENHEKDLARQVIITSQIAARKFKLFNLAMAFTFSGLLTPLSLIVYEVFLDKGR